MLGFGLGSIQGYPKGPIIDAYDTFIIDPSSVRYHFRQEDWMGRTIKGGDNVRFVYERNIAPIADYVSFTTAISSGRRGAAARSRSSSPTCPSPGR